MPVLSSGEGVSVKRVSRLPSFREELKMMTSEASPPGCTT